MDSLLRQLGGCGRFQVILTTCVSLTYASAAFTTIFMVFGNYNPGWRCLDNLTLSTNYTRDSIVDDDGVLDLANGTSNKGFGHSCQGFSECEHVEFDPSSSTIVTEWGLICHENWKSIFIITLFMIGITVGGTVSGYFGDILGRKFVLYVNVLVLSITTFASVIVSSWQMFAGLRFVLGVSCGMIVVCTMVYMSEFVTPRWRAIVASLPLWCLGCLLFSLCAFVTKDWKQIHIFNGALSALLILPAFFCPESIRWLKVNHKKQRVIKALGTIAKLNRASDSTFAGCSASMNIHFQENKTSSFKSITRLFGKKYIIKTLILGMAAFTSNLVYFVSSFGMAALPGDIYVNNILVYFTELPANVIGWFLPDILGRKKTAIGLHLVQSVSLFVFIVFNFYTTGSVQMFGALVSIIICRICCDLGYFLVLICATELFPTVIRTAANGAMLFFAGLGSILSTYFISSDHVMFVSFFIMAAISLVCGGLFLLIPETVGKNLKDDFRETDSCENTDDHNHAMNPE